jgi:hypothetical protein
MVVYVDGETPLQYSYDEGEGVLATRKRLKNKIIGYSFIRTRPDQV